MRENASRIPWAISESACAGPTLPSNCRVMRCSRLFGFFVVLALAVFPIRAQNEAEEEEVIGTPSMAKQVQALDAAGSQKFEAGDPAGAVEDFKRAFELARQRANRTPDEPAVAAEVYELLGKLAPAFSAAGDLANALKTQQRCADGFLKIATDDATAENKEKAGGALGRLAWYELLSGDAASALTSARRAVEMDPAQLWVKANLAHALLATGAIEDAKMIYRAERTNDLGDGTAFEEGVLADFEKMERAGVGGEGIGEVREMYGVKPHAEAQSGTASGSPAPRAFRGNMGSWWWVGIPLLVLALILLPFLLLRRRSPHDGNLAKAGGKLGFKFKAEPPPLDHPYVAGTHLVKRGRKRTVLNLLEKESDGTQFAIFDFSYLPGREDRQFATQTVIHLRSPKLCLPWFTLCPRPPGIAVDAPEIPIGRESRFSELYAVHGDDEPTVRALFTGATLAFCEQQKGLVIERRQDYLLAYWEGRRPKAQELERFVGDGQQIFALFSQATAT